MKTDYEIKYVSASGVVVELTKGAYYTNAGNIPSWEFDTVSLNDKVIGLKQKKNEIECEIVIAAGSASEGITARNKLYEVAASDRVNKTPGKLYFGDWFVTGYVRASSMSDYVRWKDFAKYKVKFVATEPLWVREVTKTFTPRASNGLDYPHDFAFDFASTASADSIINENYSPSLVRITVQGAAQNPSVTIGGNEYRVNVNLQAGEYLEIEPLKKTIEVVSSTGIRTNVFDKRNGVQVIGSGSYIFEKIGVGELPVLYSNGLTFSVTVIEQRAEPRWS